MAKIVFFGNGQAPIESIIFLKNQLHQLLIIVDPKDDGCDSWQKSLLKYCNNNNLFFLQPTSLKDEVLLTRLREFAPDIILSIQCRQIIQREIIDLVNGEIFNFHFADLPQNRGCYPLLWHILNGDKFAGLALHKITEGIDDGPIIDKVKKEITIDDTTKSLYLWCIEQTFVLMQKNINLLIQKQYKELIQDIKTACYYSRSSVNFENLFINWNKPAKEVARFIQAFIFPPFQFPQTRFKKDIISISRVINIKTNKRKTMPGTILSVNLNQAEVQTGDGAIVVEIHNVKDDLKPDSMFYL